MANAYDDPEHVSQDGCVVPAERNVKLTEFGALSFDCYGTLIDWETGISAFLTSWAAKQGRHVDKEELLALYAKYETQAEAKHPADLYPKILAVALQGLAEQLGLHASPDDLAQFGASVPYWPAFPDSSAALSMLQKSRKLIVLSNVDRQSFAASSARLGIQFDAVITAQDVGCYKPNKNNFEALRSRTLELGVASGKLLHVAQSLFHDHVPAKAAGFSTVWINRRHNRPGWGATLEPEGPVRPDFVFTSVKEFAQVITATNHS
jgi:2-haloacid dehalogenase